MFVIILTILILIYAAAYWTRKKNKKFGQRAYSAIRRIHFGILYLLFVLSILAFFDIFLRGYWTTKILIWIYIFSAIALFSLCNKTLQKKLERFYYGIFFYTLIVALPLSFVPFLGSGIVFTIFSPTIGESSDIKYSDSQFRLEKSYHSFLTPPSPPDLYVKRGLIEYKEKPLKMAYIHNLSKIEIKPVSQNKISLFFYSTDFDTQIADTTTITIELEH